ncbi:hypothetical protein [Methylobacter sp. S3L5C]|uniref:hypothetical protein n=1 Tax=Methylobacter sp. S3L5C TaxID=2839024 RepID=UPI001FADBA3F|nr:hypothetical protein [Methylobacter sp. S3L5C]UOA08354.1 hypothetical protein KKZ03_19460 [Methylobacter sp. S3L5C]
MSLPTLEETLGELDAGIFTAKVTSALKLVSLGVIENRKKGQVTIALDLEQIGDSSSVQVKSTLKYNKPTKNGKATEENTTSTPMYVDGNGYLTISPQTQNDLFAADKNNNVTKIGR